ncbi:MAG: TRAP transporter small permease [Spirochaetaceae bacterium]
MRWIDVAVRRLMMVVTFIVIVMTVVMFVIVGYNVYMRYVINRSVGWADELSRFLFIWMSLLGAAMAFEKGQHVGLDFVIDRIRNPKVRIALLLFGDLLVMFVVVVLFRQGIAMMQAATNRSPALRIHMAHVFASVPAGVGLMVLLNLLRIAEHTSMAITGRGLGFVEEEGTEAQQAVREVIEKQVHNADREHGGD